MKEINFKSSMFQKKSKIILKNDIKTLEILLTFGSYLCVHSWSYRKTFALLCIRIIYIFMSLSGRVSEMVMNYYIISGSHFETIQYCLFAISVILGLNLNIIIFYGYFCDVNKYKLLLRSFAKIDHKMATKIFLTNNVKLSLAIMALCFGVYCLVVTYIFSTSAIYFFTCLNDMILFYQTFCTVTIYWFICTCLERRYDLLDKEMKSLMLQNVTAIIANGKIEKLAILKNVYQNLNNTVIILNTIYGKFIIHVLLFSFFYFVNSINVMMFLKGTTWRHAFITSSSTIIYLVSTNVRY